MEEIKEKQDPSGHGVETHKENEKIYLQIDFYVETGRKAVIFGEKISGSMSNELKVEWQSNYGTCLKRIKPGYMKREVKVSPGGARYYQFLTIADLYEDNFKFDIYISIDENPKSKTYKEYYLDFGISGLKWIGSHILTNKSTRIDRHTCKIEPIEDKTDTVNLEVPISSSFGGKYKGYPVTVNTIKGSKTTKDPTGELREDNEITRKLEAKSPILQHTGGNYIESFAIYAR